MAVFLLPASERLRRQLVLLAALATCAAIGALPVAPLERVVARVTDPLTRPLAWASGAAVDALRGTESAPSSAPPARDLAVVERRLGRPSPLAGRVWAEAPVTEAAFEEGRLRVARPPGASWTQAPVVYGNEFVGRVEEVADGHATVLLWSAADQRTGVEVTAADGRSLSRAVCLGRGRGGPPVVGWIEHESALQEGLEVRWRPRADDPSAFDAARWRLGTLQRRGDPERGEALWVLPPQWPAGLRGRVYVAVAEAPGAPLEAPAMRTPATPLLAVDGVLGSGWAAVRVAADRAARVITGAAGVVGPVVARRGGVAWVRRRAPDAWGEEAVVLGSGDPPRFLAASERAGADAPFHAFTRGGAGVPRGLWIGALGDARPPLATPLHAWTANPPAGD